MTLNNSQEQAPLFERVRFIMVNPSHPGNVGSAARAIKTMGFHQLCLVSPQHPEINSDAQAIALASGATDVLAAATITDTLEQALAPTTLAFALTARARVLGPPACDIRQAAHISQEHLVQHPGSVAIVLGTEKSGLTNADIALCQRVCHIPANPEYSSLNVAQALQLAAWELRYALASAQALPLLPTTEGEHEPGNDPATNEKIHAFLTHWEQAITDVKFLDPRHPKKLMPRMRHLFGRAGLTHDEVDMLRGLCAAMIKAAKSGQ